VAEATLFFVALLASFIGVLRADGVEIKQYRMRQEQQEWH
jgi:hypothetical protein